VRYDVQVNGRRRQVTVARHNGQLAVELDGREWAVDAAVIGAHTLSILAERVRPDTATPGDDRRDASEASDAVSGGSRTARVKSHEVSIAADPVSRQFTLGMRGVPILAGLSARRRWGSADAGSAGSGPQRIVAPMPGKIVRVLVRPGDTVQSRQPVIVVEAMKMENELRASYDGTVSEMLVQEGQSVEAGALLAMVTPS
jgi:biotin carboxyl carrier protein